jgi:hypothetical protein
MKRHLLTAIALVALVVAAITLPALAKKGVVLDTRTGLSVEVSDSNRPMERAPTAGENLEVFLFQAPVDAVQNEDIADSLVLHIRNSGTTQVDGFSWQIVLSDDAVIEEGNQNLFGWYTYETILPGGTLIHDFSAETISIRFDEETGGQYIGVILDSDNFYDELDETDNIAYLPITILEDLSKRTVYAEDFQDGDGGWTSEDLTITTQSWWNRTDYLGRGVMWCGGDDPAWSTGPGYGNNWNERLRKSFALPAGNPAIQYTVQYDTEPGYDFFTLEASTDGGLSFTELDSHNGNSGGFVTHVADLTSFAEQDVVIQFRVESDGGWSDEDGLHPTDGAARLDSVSVTGYGTDDFETDNDGWEPFLSPGSSSQLYRLEQNPYCYFSYNCDEYGAGAKAGEPAVTCNAWVAYDPVKLEFPYTPPTESDIRIAITSPVFSLPADATTYRLAFDVYHRIVNFPGDGVFFGYEVSAPAGTPWQNVGNLYYTNNGWTEMSFDVTSFALGANDIQIRLVGREAGAYSTTGVHTEGPYFDNVRLIVAGGSSGGIDDSLFPRACSYQPGDSDGDGVFDVDDGEPTISAVPFDRDGDGVLDDPRGARHIEYWLTRRERRQRPDRRSNGDERMDHPRGRGGRVRLRRHDHPGRRRRHGRGEPGNVLGPRLRVPQWGYRCGYIHVVHQHDGFPRNHLPPGANRRRRHDLQPQQGVQNGDRRPPRWNRHPGGGDARGRPLTGHLAHRGGDIHDVLRPAAGDGGVDAGGRRSTLHPQGLSGFGDHRKW